jgi:uncharacterized protein
MARKFFQKYLPHPDKVRTHRVLSVFGKALHAPNLWHLNRDSVSRAFAIGLFWAWFPMPFQMLPAALCAIIARGNIGLSVALVWLSNPLTMGPIFYGSYALGRRLLGNGTYVAKLEFTYSSITEHLWLIWQPLYLGSVVMGILIGGTAYLVVQLLWRWNLRRRWHRRLRVRHELMV